MFPWEQERAKRQGDERYDDLYRLHPTFEEYSEIEKIKILKRYNEATRAKKKKRLVTKSASAGVSAGATKAHRKFGDLGRTRQTQLLAHVKKKIGHRVL